MRGRREGREIGRGRSRDREERGGRRDWARNSLILVESQAKKEHYEQMVSVPEHLEVGAPKGKGIKYIHMKKGQKTSSENRA